jgi:hypothetical protein
MFSPTNWRCPWRTHSGTRLRQMSAAGRALASGWPRGKIGERLPALSFEEKAERTGERAETSEDGPENAHPPKLWIAIGTRQGPGRTPSIALVGVGRSQS